MLIPAVKLRIQFDAIEDLYFQEYSGSTFRGSFGIQLRNLCCLTDNDKCNDCQHASTCIYKNIFEQQYITSSEKELNITSSIINASEAVQDDFNNAANGTTNTDILTLTINRNTTNVINSKITRKTLSQKKINIPNPYIIEPLPMNTTKIKRGESFSICVNVLGRAIEYIDTIIISFYNGALVGYGKEDHKKKARLVKVFQQDDTKVTERLLYYFPKNFNNFQDKSNNFKTTLQKHLRPNFNYIFWEFSKISKDRSVTLVFTTPLRLIENNRVIPAEELTAEKILSSIVRRVCNFVKYNLTTAQKEKFVVHNKMFDCKSIDHRAEDQNLDNRNVVDNCIYRICVDDPYLEYIYSAMSSLDMTTNLKWKDWSRYSNRQKKPIGLGGNIGEITFFGNVAPFLAYILLGSFLHIGKSTVLGLGNYYIKR